MGLSDELISQFAKITKDNTKTKSETTVYGTTVKYNGNIYVRLDGSELLTPVTTTANTKENERVTVMIKDHSAVITGNMSSPSASSRDVSDVASVITELEIAIAEKVDTEELVAEQARIDKLEAANVVINNTLYADDGVIANLTADYAEVSKKLTAVEADIENLDTTKLNADIATLTYATIEDLNATNADIYNLEATYAEFKQATIDDFKAVYATIENLQVGEFDAVFATIGSLEAERARIDLLQADLADIDTLIFGSATGNTIQASFANAVIAQLSNAQIKSAMIDSVSADKITAGDIITNNVHVKSEDGKLLISDETIQISDTTRVRVQIGKDTNGDYSINVWDADGNLMFSEGGITDNAIKDAIIRNDMISDTANISAHKLNIDTLFEVINGSSKTINSTRIYLDSEGQQLDVAFESITSDIDELQNGVTSQGTQIAVIQGQIAGKVWQTDIDETTEFLTTQYSELLQELDGVKVTVANHEAEINDVVGISDRVAKLEIDADSFETAIRSTEQHMEGADNRVTEVESLIQQLSNSISTLVTDGNGQSLMTQTDNGWTFSTGEIQNIVNATSDGLNALVNDMSDVNSAVQVLEQAVSDIGVLTEYVKISVYEGEPCIELGESDSDFKLLITNTRIMFMEGSGIPAYINNQSLFIKKAVIQEELQQGEFVWKARANGNLGLIWKGAAS